VILVDSDVLVALVNRSDRRHRACVEALRALREPLGTVWPVLMTALTSAEALPAAQAAILEMLSRGALTLLAFGQDDVPRLRELMAKRRRKQISVARAALIRVAERDGCDTVFTLAAGEFAAHRIGGRRRLRLLPKVGAAARGTSRGTRRVAPLR
jgi:predicted nucleic acid-binding protein